MLKIQQIGSGILGTNTYVIKSDKTALVVDPDGNTDKIINALEGANPSAVLLTHGHFDHIGGANAVSKHFGIPIYVHELDEEMLYDSVKNASFTLLCHHILVDGENVRTLTDGAELSLEDITVKALHTPGHTRGSISYLIEDHLFSGDLIFDGSYGRTDLYGGDFVALMHSIKSLASLPGNVTVHTGHGRSGFTLCEYFDDMGL